MTLEKQQIEIAKIRGWTIEFYYEDYTKGGRCRAPNTQIDLYGSPLLHIPNYPKDLNAMHEAEKILYPPGMGKTLYEKELDLIIKRDTLHSRYVDHKIFSIAHATAEQKAEAFLRRFNLWKETN